MKEIILALLLSPSFLFSQWYGGWNVAEGEFPQHVVIVDTFVAFISAENFYSDTSYIYKLSFHNGWQKIPMSSFMYEESITCIAARDSNHAWTTNGGLNWQTNYIPNSSHFVSNVVFMSNNAYGLCTPWDVLPVNIYRSINGGQSWILNNITSHAQPIQSLDWAEGTSNWYYCTSDEGAPVYKSTNNGQTWFAMETTNTEQLVSLDIKRLGNSIFGYAVTFQGSILQLFGDTISNIGINPQGTNIPLEFSLSQNYPNPFNPSTKIKFSIPPSKGARGMMMKLCIYDILGREVAVLVNEQLNPGYYEVTWDASDFPSGVYFYKLTAADASAPLSITKKMVLVK